ncbi:unnamed protein product [Somion occarium]|uniref:Uncharacterized protein n=1 Tax=Somion occarium TaxID=3059160 RepID=A0ABP1ED05_9APHY
MNGFNYEIEPSCDSDIYSKYSDGPQSTFRLLLQPFTRSFRASFSPGSQVLILVGYGQNWDGLSRHRGNKGVGVTYSLPASCQWNDTYRSIFDGLSKHNSTPVFLVRPSLVLCADLSWALSVVAVSFASIRARLKVPRSLSLFFLPRIFAQAFLFDIF